MRVAKCLIGVSGFTNQLTGSPMSPSTTGTAASSTRSGGCWPLPSTSTTTKLWLVQSVIVLLALPSHIGTTMPALAVPVSDIVHLEAASMLQVVARLFGLQAGHHGRALGDVHDHKTTGLWQGAGDLPKSVGRRHAVRARAEFELTQRADVAQLTDAVMAVVVGQT